MVIFANGTNPIHKFQRKVCKYFKIVCKIIYIFGHSTKSEPSIYDEFSFILETSIIILAPCVKKKIRNWRFFINIINNGAKKFNKNLTVYVTLTGSDSGKCAAAAMRETAQAPSPSLNICNPGQP